MPKSKSKSKQINSPSLNLESTGEGIELVFGLVAPTGVDLGKVYESLKAELKSVNYSACVIRLSELISLYLSLNQPTTNEYERIKTLMERGTQLREATKQNDIVGRLGIGKIRAERAAKTGDHFIPAARTAYIVSSFKRPEEIELFRQIYGKAFTLISVYSPRDKRTTDLTKRLRSIKTQGKSSEELAVELIERDYQEEGRNRGQRLGKTFPLADYFIPIEPKLELDKEVSRLIQLTFGNPYISPTKDEQGMFFAQAAALRSLDLSRQVGAAITDDDGSVLAAGCNEVPKFGGGLYWCDSAEPARDFELGYDANNAIKREILEDTFQRLRSKSWLAHSLHSRTDKSLVEESLLSDDAFLSNSLLFDVIEFGRAVHAEAAAISDAAKRGVATKDSHLYCTTFPCHICARHIVASGIREVIFIEPYEKSRTDELYRDSVSIEPREPSSKKTNFRSFSGVAPRRYMDYFQLTTSRKKTDGSILQLEEIAEEPKIKRAVLTYLAVEDMVIRQTKPSSHQQEIKND